MMCHAITKVDWTLFADIQPYELFGNVRRATPRASRSFADRARAGAYGSAARALFCAAGALRGVFCACQLVAELGAPASQTKQFNRLTLWVVNAVLELSCAFLSAAVWVLSLTSFTFADGSSERAALLQQFIALAQRLWERNNFHGSYAVLCGLNAASVQRLRRSWGKVAKKSSRTFEELMALNSHTRNYKAYRLHVRAATPPMVPQIGIISRDLFGLEGELRLAFLLWCTTSDTCHSAQRTTRTLWLARRRASSTLTSPRRACWSASWAKC